MAGGSNGSIFGPYAVIKAFEPGPSASADVRAEHAALDQEELRELEAQLYGLGPAAPRDPTPVHVERVEATPPHLRPDPG